MTKNKLILADPNFNGQSLKQLYTNAAVARYGFFYLIWFIGFSQAGLTKEFLIGIAILELLIFLFLRPALLRKREPNALIMLIFLSVSPTIVSLGSFNTLWQSKVSSYYYVAFILFYIVIEAKAYYNYRLIRFDRLKGTKKLNKVFKTEDETVEYTFLRYAKTVLTGKDDDKLDNILTFGVLIPLAILTPMANFLIFPSATKDYDKSAILLAWLGLILASMFNSVSTDLWANWRLVQMKKKGEL